MTIPIAGSGERVHRMDPVAGSHEGSDEESPVGLYAHHHVGGFLDEGFNEFVEPSHSFNPFGDPSFAESRPRAILHTDVVVRFGPVHADKDLHRASSRCREPEEAIGPLMEVLKARHPTSRVGILADQQRHDLAVGLKVQLRRVLIC